MVSTIDKHLHGGAGTQALCVFRKFLNIQALMCVALMSILYHVGTSSRSLTQLVTCGQVSN